MFKLVVHIAVCVLRVEFSKPRDLNSHLAVGISKLSLDLEMTQMLSVFDAYRTEFDPQERQMERECR